MLTVPVDLIPTCLRNYARGDRGVEAAVELLIAHGVWLTRSDFLTDCVAQGRHPDGDPYVWVDWELTTAFLDEAGCAASEARILCIAAELAGVDSGRTLADLLRSLDERNTCLVIAAVAHNGHLDPHRHPELTVGSNS